MTSSAAAAVGAQFVDLTAVLSQVITMELAFLV